MKKQRLDVAMVDRGIEESRARARAMILAGEVQVDGERVTKAGHPVRAESVIALRGERLPYVSRGGLKLEQALGAFDVPVEGVVAMDVGASTGGFTDCLLQHGAQRVYAVDVGYGQLAWKLRQDPRVVVHERTNIRHLQPEVIPEPVGLFVIDCSFIGLDRILPNLPPFLSPDAEGIALVKPQFEVGPGGVGKGGVVRDAALRQQAIDAVGEEAERCGFTVAAGEDCETHGPSGNVEYLMHLRRRVTP